ncbi:uncharacterized protein LOC111018147 isoform X1 [Momordica charantia]|uniref:Uncharacterized protein LOC111018147 isoform X1 n=1 Tax=Momordica charantia TaxID=3673 RepID=A0A6J1D9H7_MOMCH|nr:uncharacterized protein LOC111018147 isoform X1 [Momordica charantia]
MMPSHGVAFSLIFVLFLAQNAIEATSIYVNVSDQEPMMVPLMGLGEKMETAVVMSGGRRRLRSFQVCALCTCCGGARGMCLPSPCCYAINCNIPNRPFGFCSFTPKTCNCFGCHI